MVATYRSSDTDPKERFVHQQAGDGGFGGSSYIDLVAFREKDANTAWTSASDGTLEERLYYCQNQHADVVALITAAGGQREMDRYSPYGVPFGLPTGDCDSDGDCDVNDRNQVQAWINASNKYDVRGDIDLDGDTDATDKTNLRNNFEGVTLGAASLSADATASAFGHSGYWSSRKLSQARHRWLVANLGVWLSRDILGQTDGPGLTQFCQSNPNARLDASGLKARAMMPHEPPSTGPSVSIIVDEFCCLLALANGQSEGDYGGVVCCYGKPVPCVWIPSAHNQGEGKRKANGIIYGCAKEHERAHIDRGDVADFQCRGSHGWKTGERPTFVGTMTEDDQRKSEEEKGLAERECVRGGESDCNAIADEDQKSDCKSALFNRQADIKANLLKGKDKPTSH
ncbi:MAG: hypothetical protein IPK67_18365 [Planctomycetes bacterium]|nr:hypothetical protein [Planctomycetota bacterium]